MKVWLDQVGISTLTLRLPSVLACGLAAGLVVVLGSLLFTPRAGLLAGLVMAVCPRVTLIGAEGRSAAWFTAAAVLLVLLVVLAVRRPVLGSGSCRSPWRPPSWAACTSTPPCCCRCSSSGCGRHPRPRAGGAGSGGSGCRAGGSRRCSASSSARCPVTLLAWRARSQQAQVDWIDPPTLESLAKIATETVAPLNGLWAVLAWAMAAAGLVWLARHRRGRRGTTFLLVGWAVFPGLALLSVSAAWTPLYSQRYLAFCLGGLAVLAGAGLASVRRGWLAFCLAAALPLASAVTYRDQREVDAWDSWARSRRSSPTAAPRRRGHRLPARLGDHRVLPRRARHRAGPERGRRPAHPALPVGRAAAPAGGRAAAARRAAALVPLAGRRRGPAHQPTSAGCVSSASTATMLERSDAEQTWLFTRTAAQTERGDRLLRTPG